MIIVLKKVCKNAKLTLLVLMEMEIFTKNFYFLVKLECTAGNTIVNKNQVIR